MLDTFIQSNRDELLRRAKNKVAERSAPPTQWSAENAQVDGTPLFLDQLIHRLRGDFAKGEIGTAASANGAAMLRGGFSVAQVVQGYGDVCQAVTELALTLSTPIATDDFHTLNHCLDMAIADAVSEFEHQRDRVASQRATEHLGILAHELRNQLGTAMMAFDLLRRGQVGIGSATGAILGRSLTRLHHTIDRTLTEVRLNAGGPERERMRVTDLIEEVEVAGTFEANARGVKLVVIHGDREAEIEVDRHILASALSNLLRNAVRFTPTAGCVTIAARTTNDRVFVDVEDACGGLPAGSIEGLFVPNSQRGADRTGLGLGLTLSRRGVEANGGDLRARDIPGKGCVFTIELPRAAPSHSRRGDLSTPR